MEYFQIKMDLLINYNQWLEGKKGEETMNDEDSICDIFYSRTMYMWVFENLGNYLLMHYQRVLGGLCRTNILFHTRLICTYIIWFQVTH